jgi:hypothetical protein
MNTRSSILREQVDGTAAFIKNDGQWPARACFVARSTGGRIVVEPLAISLEWDAGGQGPRASQLRLEFENANEGVVPVGLDELPTQFNFLLGSDPQRWRTSVQAYRRVLIDDVYAGVDLQIRSSEASLEYDVLVEPGASVDGVAVWCDGAVGLSIDPDGALIIATPRGSVRQPAPATWELAPDGSRQARACRYRLLGSNRFGFLVEGWSENSPLVIDPGLEWSTYLGGAGHDRPHTVALTDNGDVVIAGETESSNFPATPGVLDPSCNSAASCADAFVSRLSADGKTVVYSTYLGGILGDRVVALAVSADDDVTLIGWTNSADFPVTSGALNQGNGQVFVTRISHDGSLLILSARFGGSILEVPLGGLLDASGNIVVYGYTASADFPTTGGALDSIQNQNSDGFLARLSADGSQLLYGSYLGGDGPDSINAAMIEPSGRLVIAASGGADGPRFPPATPGAFDTTYNSIYIARLSPDWSAVDTATFLGGISGERANALASGPNGTVVVAGFTYSPDFPVTPDAIQKIAPSTLATSGFVTCFNSSLSALVFSTYLGGGPTAEVCSVDVDVSGQVTVAGRTDGGTFPVTPGALDVNPVGVDCFVSRISPDGRRLDYSTFLGGSLGEAFSPPEAELAVDPLGSAIIATHSNSTDYPVTPGAFQGTLAGGLDAAVTRLDMLPTGVSKFGTSTPGCLGPLAAGVTSMPQAGSDDFAVTCTAAPLGSTQGLLALSLASLPVSQTALGTQLWLDPFHLFALVPAKSVGAGFSTVGLRIPGGPAAIGLKAFAQFLWKDPCGPAGWSASNALHIVVQP